MRPANVKPPAGPRPDVISLDMTKQELRDLLKEQRPHWTAEQIERTIPKKPWPSGTVTLERGIELTYKGHRNMYTYTDGRARLDWDLEQFNREQLRKEKSEGRKERIIRLLPGLDPEQKYEIVLAVVEDLDDEQKLEITQRLMGPAIARQLWNEDSSTIIDGAIKSMEQEQLGYYQKGDYHRMNRLGEKIERVAALAKELESP